MTCRRDVLGCSISGAPYRPPRRAAQLLLTHDGFEPRQTDGFERLEAEIALAEWRLSIMRDRLAKLRARKTLKLVTISKVDAEPVTTRSA